MGRNPASDAVWREAYPKGLQVLLATRGDPHPLFHTPQEQLIPPMRPNSGFLYLNFVFLMLMVTFSCSLCELLSTNTMQAI